MKAPELSEPREAGDDLFDVRALRMVPEVHKALRLVAELLRGDEAGAPVRDHRRVEGGLVELVLHEHPPIGWQRRVYLAHRVEVAIESRALILLARKIRSVGDPDRNRRRSQLLANLDAIDVVLDGLFANRRFGMG